MEELHQPKYTRPVKKVKGKELKEEFKLTLGQNTVLRGMLKAIKDYDTGGLLMILEGSAGTGKTTLLRYLVHYLKGYSIVGSAPTHKAVSILAKSIKVKTATLHKLLGLRPDVNLEDFDPSNPKFSQIATPTISETQIVIVDEASMINRNLLKVLYNESKNENTIIIFVGDRLQLPPVKESYSKVFDIPLHFELTEIVRQEAGHPLLELLGMARNDIATNGNSLIMHLFRNLDKEFMNDEGMGYATYSYANSVSEFGVKLVDTIRNNIIDTRYLAFTNPNILDWNSYVRKSLIKSKNILTLDDVMMGYKTVLDENMNPIITNSLYYKPIDDVLDFRDKDGNNLKGYLTSFKNIDTGGRSPAMFVLDHEDKPSVELFKRNYYNLLIDAQSKQGSSRYKAWKSFYAYTERIMLLRDIELTANIKANKTIDFIYGSTIHKSQGSTYRSVFLNLRNVLYDKWGNPVGNIKLRNKLIYVALSRASIEAHILI